MIIMEIKMPAETFYGEHNAFVLPLLNKDRNEEDSYCDAVLQIKGENFNVHRCLLGSLSSYFNKTFKCEMKEKYVRTIDLTKFSVETIKAVLDFVYTTKVSISEENAVLLLEAADYFLMYVEKHLFQIFNLNSHCKQLSELCSIGKIFHCESLQANSEDVVLKHFKKVLKQPSFKTLSSNDVEAIIQALDQKDLGSKPVYEGILSWIHHDYDKRKRFFTDLFQCVKLHLLPTKYLQGVVAQQELVMSSHVCKDHLLSETLYAMEHQNRKEPAFESSSSSENEDHGESESCFSGSFHEEPEASEQAKEKYTQQTIKTEYSKTIHANVKEEEKEQLALQAATSLPVKPQNAPSNDQSSEEEPTMVTNLVNKENEKSFEGDIDEKGNPVERKMYDRSFLMQLRFHDTSLEKPSYLSNFEDIVVKNPFSGVGQHGQSGSVSKKAKRKKRSIQRKSLLTNAENPSNSSNHDPKSSTSSATENEQTDKAKIQKAKEELEVAEAKERRRMLGNVRFIGELFKFNVLAQAVMHDCILTLFKHSFEESCELLCHLIATFGKKDLKSKKGKEYMEQYFTQIDKIIQERKCSDRVRSMLVDLIELRQNNWEQQAVKAQSPITIEQTHADAKEENEQLFQVAAASAAPPINPQTAFPDV